MIVKTTSFVAAALISMTATIAGAAPVAAPRPELPGFKDFLGCGKLPADKKSVKLNLKPRSNLVDLITFMTALSCKPFAPAANLELKRPVGFSGSQTFFPEEIYRLFITELASADLTVRPTEKAIEIVARKSLTR
jgi:hypothetical protein